MFIVIKTILTNKSGIISKKMIADHNAVTQNWIVFDFIPVLFSPALALSVLFNHKAMCYSGFNWERGASIVFIYCKSCILK